MSEFSSNETIKQSKPAPRVALVHDFLVSYGGAERVFEELAALYPDAPIYTLLYDEERMGSRFQGRDIRVSWLGQLPRFIQKRYRLFLPFFPAAVEGFDLRAFDVVISSSGAWSKGIVTRLHTTHVAYLHSPMRYAWDYHESYLQELGARGRRSILTRMLMSYLRIWDKQAAERPDVLVANSGFTQARIAKYYRREAEVVYPPAFREEVTLESVDARPERKYFLVVSRLTRSKKVDTVIDAFNKLGLPLLVVGTGPEEKRLKKMAQGNIEFSGFLSEQELVTRYRGARALLCPSEEDFGMVAVEALSFGTPIIGLDYGGLREIMDDRMGEFFHGAAPEIIAEGVRRFLKREGDYDTVAMRERAAVFSRENFQKGIQGVIEKL